MFRSLIAIAALACSAMLSAPAFAAPPIDPILVHVVASGDDAIAPVADVIAPAEVCVAEPVTVHRASTGD